MWTPKRVLLLSAGIAIFLSGYAVYAFFLGGIDGLPPLQEGFLPSPLGPVDLVKMGDNEFSDIDKKLQLAFGQQCTQISRPFKFEITKKNLVVSAAEANFKEPDGRVKLTDFSVALFKPHPERRDRSPEITTVTSNTAYLTFDQKIESPTDMSKARIVGGELRGNILITNNHCTPEKFDDLEIVVDNHPIFYDDRAAKIWTDGIVKLLDKQSQPHPMKISGQGLTITLRKDPPKDKKQPAIPPTATATAKTKSDLSDVESIVLNSMVEMHLYTDSNAGFMTGSGKLGAPALNRNPSIRSR